MDGYKKPKVKKFGGVAYSETRYAAIKFLQREVPLLKGRVIEVSAGNWDVPRGFLNKNEVTQYISFDKKIYGDSKNKVNVYGDVHDMPFPSEYADGIINSQSFQNYYNPFKAIGEMYRVLKKGGVLLLDCGFNTNFFGYGSTPESLKKKNHVQDYWRITKNGWELLTKGFSKVKIEESGPNSWEPYCYMIKAVK